MGWDELAQCIVCREELNLLERAGEDICRACKKARDEREAQERAATEAHWTSERDDWESLIKTLSFAPRGDTPIVDRVVEAYGATTLLRDEKQALAARAARTFATALMAEGTLSLADEEAIFGLAERLELGRSWDSAWLAEGGLDTALQVAGVNAGRLAAYRSEHLMNPQKGELVHYTVTGATLLRVGKQSVRTYRGVSLPIGKTRARYHFGSSRGRIVSTGWEAADRGTFLITSQRAIFMGRENSKVVPYRSLLDIQVFNDGLEFFRDDRVRPIPILLGAGIAEVAAATVHVAASRALGTWEAPAEPVPSRRVTSSTSPPAGPGQPLSREEAFLEPAIKDIDALGAEIDGDRG